MGRQTTRAVEHSLPPLNKLYTYNRYPNMRRGGTLCCLESCALSAVPL